MEYEDELRQLTSTIWESILNLPVEAADALPSVSTPAFASSIRIAGAWEGAVTVSCGPGMAGRAAEIMFGVEKATAADMRDALCELVNMVGGNLEGAAAGVVHAFPSDVGLEPRAIEDVAGATTRVRMKCGDEMLNVFLSKGPG